jgi:hypothetical protein
VLSASVIVLVSLGAVDARGITPLGRALARLPVEPRLGAVVLAGKARETRDERPQPRQQHVAAGHLEHQSVGQVVDVLGSAGEMQKRHGARKASLSLAAFAKEVFHRLHVMIGGGLDLFHTRGGCGIEIVQQRFQKGVFGVGEGCELRDFRCGSQGLQPTNLDFQSRPDEGEFAQGST